MNQEKIWDHYQNEGVENFDQAIPRLTFLCKHLNKKERVLNIGVGNGTVEKLAQASGVDIYCLDPNERAIKNISDRLKLAEKAKVGYSQKTPFEDNFFDAVVMSEVLEHLSDEVFQQTLFEIKRILKNEGRFLITVPFNEHLLASKAVCPNCAHIFHRIGHMQSFTKKRLQGLLEEAGFSVNKIKVRCFPDWRRKGVVNFFKSFIRYILGRFGVNIASANIFVIATK